MATKNLAEADGTPFEARVYDLGSSEYASATLLIPLRESGVAHRDAVAAADKCAPPTLSTKAAVNSEGSLTATTYYAACAPGNTFGTAGCSNVISQACALNDALDVTVPQVTGATFYDIFCSTAAAPLWVGRVTETQRAAGVKITAVGTYESPSVGVDAGKVRIAVAGTGIATNDATFAANNAYIVGAIAPIACAEKRLAYVFVKFTATDLRSAPSLSLMPVFETNEDPANQYTTQPITVWIENGATGQTKKQALPPIELNGITNLYILVGSIGGQGAAVSVWVELV